MRLVAGFPQSGQTGGLLRGKTGCIMAAVRGGFDISLFSLEKKELRAAINRCKREYVFENGEAKILVRARA
jgi:hypothetical protein